MIVLGHYLINSEYLYMVFNFEDIKKTPSNSTVLINFSDGTLLKELSNNKIKTAVKVSNIKEAIFSEALRSKYIIANNLALAIQIQKLAENYLYDSKILVEIEIESDLELIAENKIDGVIYKNAIKNIN
jgi:hypothetical protein